jgi:hypothetical protein
MVNYYCSRCGLSTRNRFDFKKHMLRQKTCKPKVSDDDIQDIYYEYFGKKESINDNLPTNAHKTPDLPTICRKMPTNAHKLPTNCPQILQDFCPIKKDFDDYLDHFEGKIFDNQCEYCGLVLSRKTHLKRHYTYCKVFKRNQKLFVKTEMEYELEKKEQIIIELLEQISNQQVQSHNQSHNNQSHNNQSHNNITIMINAFGKEDYSYLNPKNLTEYCKKPMTAISNVVQDIYYHENHQENHNLRLTNKQFRYAQVFTGDYWNYNDKNVVMDRLMDKGYGILSTHFDEIAIHELTDYQIARFKNFQDLFEREDKSLRKRLNRELEMTLLNGTIKIDHCIKSS